MTPVNLILKATSIFVGLASLSTAAVGQGWPQWGQNPQHTGSTPVLGQMPTQKLANLTYDPFVVQEQSENYGELLAHYQAPLTIGHDVFMEFISGTYVSCNPPGSYTRSLAATTTGLTRLGMRSGCTGRADS